MDVTWEMRYTLSVLVYGPRIILGSRPSSASSRVEGLQGPSLFGLWEIIRVHKSSELWSFRDVGLSECV